MLSYYSFLYIKNTSFSLKVATDKKIVYYSENKLNS